MSKILPIFLFPLIALSGCANDVQNVAHTPRLTEIVKSQIGKPIEAVIQTAGQPTNKVTQPSGAILYSWDQSYISQTRGQAYLEKCIVHVTTINGIVANSSSDGCF